MNSQAQESEAGPGPHTTYKADNQRMLQDYYPFILIPFILGSYNSNASQSQANLQEGTKIGPKH